MAINFTVDHDHTAITDEGEQQLIGDVFFTVQTRPGDFQVRNTGGGSLRTITLPKRKAYLGIDGHLYKDATSGEPFRLVANDPSFGLDHITYRADFELTTLIGTSVPVRHCFFPAPNTDTTLYLTRVMKDPDQIVMVVRTTGYAEDILDLGPVGLAVVTGTAAQARTAIGVNLIDLNEVDWQANLAAFPVTGAADVVYGARDTGKLYLWTGSSYVAARASVTAADVTDSTSTGRAVVTAASQAAARIATDSGMAQRARYGSRVVVDGDSITIGTATSSTWNQSQGGWVQEMARLSGGRIDIVHNAGVASTGIDTRLSNFASKVAPYTPETVILANGTNDVAGGDLSGYLTKLTTYYDDCRAIGAQLILGAIYPKSVNASTISAWNAAFVEWAKPRGVLVIPFWELADPATGAWPSSWTTDGTHPLRDSAAYPALGLLAWQTVARAFTEPVAPTARYVGEGIHTNFFTDLTATITGLATITAITSTTGTLVAGTYQYRVVACNFYGNSPTYDDDSITLGSTGGVTLTVGASGVYSRRRVYRKGPTDTQFKFIGQITATGSQTFTDGGVASGYDWFDGDSSRIPTGMSNSAFTDLHTLAYGPPIQTDPEIRGNFLRLSRQEGSANLRSDRFLLTGLTAGQALTVTFKCRGTNTAAQENVKMRFLDPTGATQIDGVDFFSHRLGTEWGLMLGHFVVPTGSDRVYVSFEANATSPYIDVAELRVA